MNTPPLFISYSSRDAEVADAVTTALVAADVPCWYAPVSMESDASFAAKIMNALHDCLAVAVLVSPNSDESDHVSREITIADQLCKKILPVRIANFMPQKALCYFTRSTNFLEWHLDHDAAVAKIAATYRDLYSRLDAR